MGSFNCAVPGTQQKGARKTCPVNQVRPHLTPCVYQHLSRLSCHHLCVALREYYTIQVQRLEGIGPRDDGCQGRILQPMLEKHLSSRCDHSYNPPCYLYAGLKCLAKKFIESLLNPGPTKRPTTAGAPANAFCPLYGLPQCKLTAACHPHPAHRDQPAEFPRKLRPMCSPEVYHFANTSKLDGQTISPDETSSDDDEDNSGFPFPISRRSSVSTSEIFAGETEPWLGVPDTKKPTPSLCFNNGVQPPVVGDRAKKLLESPPAGRSPSQPAPVRTQVGNRGSGLSNLCRKFGVELRRVMVLEAQ